MLAYSLILNLITIEKNIFSWVNPGPPNSFFNILKTFDRKGKLNALLIHTIYKALKQFIKLICLGLFKGVDLKHNFSCIYFDLKYIFGVNLVRIGLFVWTLKLKNGKQRYLYKLLIKSCKGHMIIASEWYVFKIV